MPSTSPPAPPAARSEARDLSDALTDVGAADDTMLESEELENEEADAVGDRPEERLQVAAAAVRAWFARTSADTTRVRRRHGAATTREPTS